MTISIDEQTDGAGSIRIDLGQRVATTLGADFALQHRGSQQYFGPDGWQQERYLFKPNVTRSPKSTVLTVKLRQIELLRSVQLTLEMPNSSFQEEFEWPVNHPSVASSSPPADPPPVTNPQIPAAAPMPNSDDLDVIPTKSDNVENTVPHPRDPIPVAEDHSFSHTLKSRMLGHTVALAILSLGLLLLAVAGFSYWTYSLAVERTSVTTARQALEDDLASLNVGRDQLGKDRGALAEASQRTSQDRQTLLLARDTFVEMRNRRWVEIQASERRLKADQDQLKQDRDSLETERNALTRDQGQLRIDRFTLDQERDALKAAQAQLTQGRTESASVQSSATNSSDALSPWIAASPSPSPWSNSSHAPANLGESDILECDRLAGNPTDGRRNTQIEPVRWVVLKQQSRTAIEACSKAVNGTPSHLRAKYQLGRAYQASGDFQRALNLMLEATRVGYPAAFDNAGNIFLQRREYNSAVESFLQGVRLGDGDSMVSLAGQIEAGRAQGNAETVMELLIGAAQRGHEGAIAELEKRRAQGQMMAKWLEVFGQIVRAR